MKQRKDFEVETVQHAHACLVQSDACQALHIGSQLLRVKALKIPASLADDRLEHNLHQLLLMNFRDFGCHPLFQGISFLNGPSKRCKWPCQGSKDCINSRGAHTWCTLLGDDRMSCHHHPPVQRCLQLCCASFAQACLDLCQSCDSFAQIIRRWAGTIFQQAVDVVKLWRSQSGRSSCANDVIIGILPHAAFLGERIPHHSLELLWSLVLLEVLYINSRASLRQANGHEGSQSLAKLEHSFSGFVNNIRQVQLLSLGGNYKARPRHHVVPGKDAQWLRPVVHQELWHEIILPSFHVEGHELLWPRFREKMWGSWY